MKLMLLSNFLQIPTVADLPTMEETQFKLTFHLNKIQRRNNDYNTPEL